MNKHKNNKRRNCKKRNQNKRETKYADIKTNKRKQKCEVVYRRKRMHEDLRESKGKSLKVTSKRRVTGEQANVWIKRSPSHSQKSF